MKNDDCDNNDAPDNSTGKTAVTKEENETRFRSVLPHESLPTNEEYGYVHIQGAFTPKVLIHDEEEEKDDEKGEKSLLSEPAPTPPTIETLKTIMMKAFRGDDDQSLGVKLPHTNLLCIEIDGDNKGNSDKSSSFLATSFTKARLCYPTPSIARDIVSFIRCNKITPSMIYNNDKDKTNNISTTCVSDNSDNAHYTYQYSNKAIQASQVTKNDLPPPRIAWPKVGPPKFRRLLPNQNLNEDEEKLALERKKTRFLFLTNIIDNESDLDDSDTNSGGSISKPIPNYEYIIQNPHLIQDAIRNALQPLCVSKESQKYPLEIFFNKSKYSSSSSSSKSDHKPFKYCYIGTRSAQDVQVLLKELQGKKIELQVNIGNNAGGSSSNISNVTERITTIKIQTGSLFLDYAAITQRCEAKLKLQPNDKKGSIPGEPSRPECTSTTDSVHVPGLVVIPNFISTEEEESTILAVLQGPDAPWAPSQSNFSKTGSLKRNVQHYGYVFDYETADVLRDRGDGNDENHVKTNSKGSCPPMPALPNNGSATWSLDKLNEFSQNAINEGRGWDVLAALIERVRRHEFGVEKDGYITQNSATTNNTTTRYPHLNQITVNEYKRGQGIGSHVDTKSAFSDGLISISLGADCVMEFKEQKTGIKKLVHLPPRSLLLMSGPARYSWEHMIVSRGTDLVNGSLIPRKTRTSITLRTAITLPDANDKVQPLDLVESNNFPPRWGNEENKESGIATPLTEKQHVHAVYDAIAKQWHHTRGKRGVLWPGATSFLKNLPRGSVVADVGCGDGKYFPAIWQAGSYVIGTDISLPLLETSVGACLNEGDEGPELRQVSKQNSSFNSRPAVAVADCMHIPLRSESCDAAICIAVMHHLSTRPRRIRCLKELARIVKKGGTVNVQAWAFEQENNSRRKFAGTDVFVPFNSQPRYLDKVSHEPKKKKEKTHDTKNTSSVAEMYSEAYDGAEYDDRKGLVVFQRYCHMYREGELESLVSEINNLEVLESGFETGNHFVIFKVV